MGAPVTKLRIAMCHSHGGGVGDWRSWIPARALQRRGHRVWFEDSRDQAIPATEDEIWPWLEDKMRWADIIHCGYTPVLTISKWMATVRNTALLGLHKSLPVVTDCDDAIFDVPVYNLAFEGYGAGGEYKRAALFHLKTSDAVSVSTPRLVELYKPFNRDVTLLPNCINPPDWEHPRDPARADSKDVRIVFAGNLGRKGDIDSIQDALEIVMRARPQVRLFFMGMMPDWAMQWCPDKTDPAANRAFFIQAAHPTLYRRIMCWIGFDIAIAPVLCNDFNAAKSNIKVLETPFYGAASVCTDWQTYADVPAESTLKCDTTYEWKESLLALIDDPSLRAKKVAACRAWALDTLCIDSNIHLWEDFYERALARPVIGDDGSGMIAGREALQTEGAKILRV